MTQAVAVPTGLRGISGAYCTLQPVGGELGSGSGCDSARYIASGSLWSPPPPTACSPARHETRASVSVPASVRVVKVVTPPVPVGPAGPCGPVGPTGPCGPAGPCVPVAP